MTINIDNYLSEDEKKEIATEAFRAECAKRSPADFERIIANSAHHVVWQQMDEFVDAVAVAKLKDKVRHAISDITAFTVFKAPDAWDRGSNRPYDILLKCVQENKAAISERVESAIHQLPNKEMRPIVIEAMKRSMK